MNIPMGLVWVISSVPSPLNPLGGGNPMGSRLSVRERERERERERKREKEREREIERV